MAARPLDSAAHPPPRPGAQMERIADTSRLVGSYAAPRGSPYDGPRATTLRAIDLPGAGTVQAG